MTEHGSRPKTAPEPRPGGYVKATVVVKSSQDLDSESQLVPVGPVHHPRPGNSSIQLLICYRVFLHGVQCIEMGRLTLATILVLLQTRPNGRLIRRCDELMSTGPRGTTTPTRRHPDSSRSHALTRRASVCRAYELDRKSEPLRRLVGAASATPPFRVP
jgi:hypothetical protein